MTLSFIEHLEQQLRESPPKQKGLRTRQRLKIATAKILARDGYHAMRVSDISARARLAEGSFYVYFKDKTDAALTVLRELQEEFLDLEVRTRSGERTPFDVRTQTWWRARAGGVAMCLSSGPYPRLVGQIDLDERSPGPVGLIVPQGGRK